MFSHVLSLSAAVPNGVLDMTADFTPLFVSMVVGLGICILGLVFTIAVHDTRQAERATKPVTDELTPLPKAA